MGLFAPVGGVAWQEPHIAPLLVQDPFLHSCCMIAHSLLLKRLGAAGKHVDSHSVQGNARYL